MKTQLAATERGETLKPTTLRRVLIVEDSPFVHQIYRVAFRRLGGWELVHSANGEEGLAALEPAPVDLIVLDINMPVMNGLQFIDRLQARPRDRNTHVLVATTEGDDGSLREALARGAKSYLKKPFTLEQLLALITRVVAVLPPRAPSPENAP